MGGDDVRSQHFERNLRVFHHPHRIAGIETGADEVFAGFLDDGLHLARLHVAGVILESDLHADVHGLGANRSKHLNCFLHQLLDGLGSPVTVVTAEPMKQRIDFAPTAFATRKPRSMYSPGSPYLALQLLEIGQMQPMPPSMRDVRAQPHDPSPWRDKRVQGSRSRPGWRSEWCPASTPRRSRCSWIAFQRKARRE